MKEQTQEEKGRIFKPRFVWTYAVLVWIFFGFMLLFYFKGDLIPNWIELGVYILFLLFSLVALVYWTVVQVPELSSYPKSEFKPYWLWYLLIGSILLTILSWGVVLLVKNVTWFFTATCSTLFLLVACWFGIKRALQQA